MKNKVLRVIGRSLLILLMSVALIFITLFGMVTVISLGPFRNVKSMFVNTVMSTSAAKFLAHIYFSDEQIEEMIAESAEEELEYSQESLDLIQIPTETVSPESTESETETPDAEEAPAEPLRPEDMEPSQINTDADGDGIEVVKITEDSFNGDLLIIYDPARVHFYSIKSFSTEGTGKKMTDIIAETGAVAALNGGGFYDPEGHGHGGMPLGPVIQDGKLVSNYQADRYTLIGMTADHKLMVGNISPSEAIANGMVEGITFGPVLVSNGQPASFEITRGGLNPRSAIGQRADGAILLMTINGRQPGSLGATFQETADVMLKYGAVNAGNLDGGSSSLMFYNGNQVNNSSSLIGMRPVPNAIIVQ